MTGETKSWLLRFDIAQIIQNKIDFSAWKGDEHIKGVYFPRADSYAYTLNKVMAIRIRHQADGVKDKVLKEDLFFSFAPIPNRFENGEDDSPTITERYPFTEMKVKPKKHFLLFDKEEVDQTDISKLFEVPYEYGAIRVKPQPIAEVLEQVNNKRERERSMAALEVIEEQLAVSVLKSQTRGKKNVLAHDKIECEILEKPKEGNDFKTVVNAHTLLYLLGIFYPFASVTFQFGRDRIMITGDKGDHTPNVEVVVSRLKTG